MLVTSRSALNIRGEMRFEVQPLAGGLDGAISDLVGPLATAGA